MQKNQNLNSNAHGITAYTKEQKLNDLRHTIRTIEEAKGEILETVDGFFCMGGLTQPIETITDLLTCFFSANDTHEVDEDNNPEPYYKVYGKEYINEVVFSTCILIKTLTQLHSQNNRVDFLSKNAEILKLEAELAQR